MKRVYGGLAALALAVVLTAGTGWNPLCVLYDRWDPLWYVFQCWEMPPNPPEGG